MTITRALLASSQCLLRYSFDYDGISAPESMTVTHAQLLADMQKSGPLYRFFNVSGLTDPETHVRFNDARLEILNRCENLVGSGGSFPGYACDVHADVDGSPELTIIFPIKDTEILAVVGLEFRHSIRR